MRLTALLLLALAAPAAAERPVAPAQLAVEPPPPPPAPAAYTRLGTRISYASLPIADVPTWSCALGLSLDRRVVGGLRFVGEYDFVWLGPPDGLDEGVAGLPASGHRLQGAARYALGRHAVTSLFELFVDADAGAGASILDDPMRGVIAPVHAFAGLRAGMTLVQPDRRAIWDYELIVRVHAGPDGLGTFLGLGMAWGE